jgi:AcrR family transcriptional regulator
LFRAVIPSQRGCPHAFRAIIFLLERMFNLIPQPLLLEGEKGLGDEYGHECPVGLKERHARVTHGRRCGHVPAHAANNGTDGILNTSNRFDVKPCACANCLMAHTKAKTTGNVGRPISREKIKKCAVALFERKGVTDTSVNDIVRKAGIAKGTFYLYFKDKDDLINFVFEKFGEEFFEEIIVKNGDMPRITNIAESMLFYFNRNRMFLIELRKNMNVHREYPYFKKTISAFSGVIHHFLNFDDRYPITQVDAYSEVLMGTIFDICYRLIIEESIESKSEAKLMLEDFMKRFFNCEPIFS